ncbi:CLUMA_CG005921, isoform A [Clunio marinus]|uniref:CLUMA_CG005921, isoform A n=1 Tax=Clunio marinus TaxID=568069 RepID=A0A1J1HWH4_9DIPT|nr:CLUMA_CG005921, isoform A [Clunio marinus]
MGTSVGCAPSPEPLWVNAVVGAIPEGAFNGGYDNGINLILCRALHEGVLIPGKFIPTYGCHVGLGGTEYEKKEFEVYVGSGSWVAGAGSNIPPNAVLGVEPEDGGPVYVCRANHVGSVTIGKLSTQGVCYIPHGWQEHSYTDFEVLTS